MNQAAKINRPATFSRAPNEKACKVLASSTRVNSDMDIPSINYSDLPESMLQCIVEKFPQGGVLEYDDNGPVSHGDLELAWHQNILKARE